MSVSTQYIVRSVIESVQREVLPHLEPQARPASHLRACLMMLANAEARIVHEARNLFEDNCELRELLRGAADNAAVLGIDCDIGALLDSYPERSYFDVAEASEENRRYQEELTQVIKRLGTKPDATEDARKDFRAALHHYLEGLDERDHLLVEAALSHVPL